MTARAPTLFGKRMAQGPMRFELDVTEGFSLHIVEMLSGRWFIRCPSFDGHGTTWATADDAARIAEHHLDRLHRALGKVVQDGRER